MTEKEKNNLFQLYTHYYDNVIEQIFLKDLSEKDWVILIKDGREQLQGFSTIQLIWLKVEQKNHLYLFSGDTIIREEARNTLALSGAFIHFMYALIENHPKIPIHWFLITKGYRTYRKYSLPSGYNPKGLLLQRESSPSLLAKFQGCPPTARTCWNSLI